MVVWCVRERTFWVVGARMSWIRYRGAIGSGLLLGALIGGCSLDEPTYLQLPEEEVVPEEADPAPVRPQPISRTDAGATDEPDAGRVPDDQGVLTGCTDGATRACGPDTVAGMCRLGTRVCRDGVWSTRCEGAVMPAQRDCSSPLDNDC